MESYEQRDASLEKNESLNNLKEEFQAKKSDLIYRSLLPLLAIHDNLDVEEYRHFMGEHLAIESDAYEYARRLINSIRSIVRLRDEPDLEDIRLNNKSEIIIKEINSNGGLERVIHAELYPHNHLVDAIIDWGTVAIGPLTLDLGYAYGNPPFSPEDIKQAINIYMTLSTSKDLVEEDLERKTRLTSVFSCLELTHRKTRTLESLWHEVGTIHLLNYVDERDFVNKMVIQRSVDIERAEEEIGILLDRKKELNVSNELEEGLEILQSYLGPKEETVQEEYDTDEPDNGKLMDQIRKVLKLDQLRRILNFPIPIIPVPNYDKNPKPNKKTSQKAKV